MDQTKYCEKAVELKFTEGIVYGTIKDVDDLGFIIEISVSHDVKWTVGSKYFIPHKDSGIMKFLAK